MRRLSIKILAFNLWLAASANLIVESGLASALGVRVQPGAGAKLSEARAAANSIHSGGLGGETLAGMYLAGGLTFEAVVQGVFAAPIMFSNLGVPSEIVAFLFAPMILIVGMDMLYIVTGRDV